jgi:biopolymer transport protein ExbD
MLNLSSELSAGMGAEGLGAAPAHGAEAHVDMTAMIDLVFMLNIFFLVTTIVSTLAEVDLPAAKHVVSADPEMSVIFTVLLDRPGRPPRVYLGDDIKKDPLPADSQDEAIAAASEAGRNAGKNAVIIKAEKAIPLRDIARIANAATSVEGMTLNLAVLEKDG